VVYRFRCLIAGIQSTRKAAQVLFDPPNERFEVQRTIKVDEQAAGDYVGFGLMDAWQSWQSRFQGGLQ
jgi:hypothetical protein